MPTFYRKKLFAWESRSKSLTIQNTAKISKFLWLKYRSTKIKDNFVTNLENLRCNQGASNLENFVGQHRFPKEKNISQLKKSKQEKVSK